MVSELMKKAVADIYHDRRRSILPVLERDGHLQE
jgi:hypothetical protein